MSLRIQNDDSAGLVTETDIFADVNAYPNDKPLPVTITDTFGLSADYSGNLKEVAFAAYFTRNLMGFNTAPYIIDEGRSFKPNPDELEKLVNHQREPILQTTQHYLFVDKLRVEALRAAGAISAGELDTIKESVQTHERPNGQQLSWDAMPNKYELYSVENTRWLESPWNP